MEEVPHHTLFPDVQEGLGTHRCSPVWQHGTNAILQYARHHSRSCVTPHSPSVLSAKPTLHDLLQVGAGEAGVGVGDDMQQTRGVDGEQGRLCCGQGGRGVQEDCKELVCAQDGTSADLERSKGLVVWAVLQGLISGHQSPQTRGLQPTTHQRTGSWTHRGPGAWRHTVPSAASAPRSGRRRP